jgi:uncharacterized damage-inducible protein DinB
MTETQKIEDQLKRAFHGEAWSGPSVKEVLDGVSAEMAAQRTLPEAHSIWELALHITAWLDIVRKRAEGETVVVTSEMNFPHVQDKTEGAWQETLKKLEAAQAALRRCILSMPETRLDDVISPTGDSLYVLLHGAVQHSLYHAGQIMLMKRFLTTLGKTPAT